MTSPAVAEDVLVDLDMEEGADDGAGPAVVVKPQTQRAPTQPHSTKDKMKKHLGRATKHLRESIISWRTRFYLFLIGCVCAAGTIVLELKSDVTWIGAFHGFSDPFAKAACLILCAIIVVPLLPEGVNEHINKLL